MDGVTQDTERTQTVDLAREPDFRLGSLRVRPATCEVDFDGHSQALQRRVMQVLVVLADARGSVVSRDQLVQRCWRGLVVTEDAIFRCISQLRKLAAGYADPPFDIETIPGVGYRLTSPSSLAEPAGDPQTTDRKDFRTRWLIVAGAIALLAIIVAIAWDGQGGPNGRQSTLVAVRSFETLTKSPETATLARQIPNAIVNELGESQIEATMAENGGTGTRANPGPMPGLIVFGQLRGEGENIVTNVRIEDGATRRALWSTEFTRDRRQVGDLSMEVAARITDVVNMATFARTADPPLTDNSSLSALIRTTELIRDVPDGGWAEMIENARGIVARNPDFAFGHSILASGYMEAARSIHIPDRVRAMREAARQEANITLKLDPQDAGAYAVLSELAPNYDHRAQERILLQGLKLAKHPKEPLGALYSYQGTLLANVGRLREALPFQLVGHATDQWGAPKTAKLVRVYANMGNLPAARKWLQKGVSHWPNHSAVQLVRRYVAAFFEPPAEGLATLQSIDAGPALGDSRNDIWSTYVAAKATPVGQSSDRIVAQIHAAADRGEISRETEIMMLAQLGRIKEAIAAANLALDRHQYLKSGFLFTPVAREIRQDPGFVALAGRMGLIDYWRKSGKSPDFCTGETARTECSPELRAALGLTKG